MNLYIRLAILAAAALILFVYVQYSGDTTLEKAFKQVRDELEKALDILGHMLGRIPEPELASEEYLSEVLPAFEECHLLFGAYLHGVQLSMYPDIPLADEDDIEIVKEAVIYHLNADEVITMKDFDVLHELFEFGPLLAPAKSLEMQEQDPKAFNRMVSWIPKYYDGMKTAMEKIDHRLSTHETTT